MKTVLVWIEWLTLITIIALCMFFCGCETETREPFEPRQRMLSDWEFERSQRAKDQHYKKHMTGFREFSRANQ